MRKRLPRLLALFTIMTSLLCASCAGAAPWTNGNYLYRYALWGVRHELSPSEDYKLFAYHSVKNTSPPFTSFPLRPRCLHYTDYNTLLLALYLEEKIWKRLGMEYPATWSIDSTEDGLELMHVALNARAIDFAKFGRLYLNRGNWNGRQIVPQQWL
jgi:hypothetical protein